jgi:HPt (histidine-containing phosphotransfer) domain-containing protein
MPDPANDVLDWDAALRRVGGRMELLERILTVFLTESDRLMGEIQAAIAAGDPSKLRCMAHSLKGSADCFAAKATVQAAQRLEVMGRESMHADAADAYAELERAIDQLKATLAARKDVCAPSTKSNDENTKVRKHEKDGEVGN